MFDTFLMLKVEFRDRFVACDGNILFSLCACSISLSLSHRAHTTHTARTSRHTTHTRTPRTHYAHRSHRVHTTHTAHTPRTLRIPRIPLTHTHILYIYMYIVFLRILSNQNRPDFILLALYYSHRGICTEQMILYRCVILSNNTTLITFRFRSFFFHRNLSRRV